MEKGKKTREVWSRFDTKILKDVYTLFKIPINSAVANNKYICHSISKGVVYLQGKVNHRNRKHFQDRAKKKTQTVRKEIKAIQNRQKSLLATSDPVVQNKKSSKPRPRNPNQQAKAVDETAIESAGILMVEGNHLSSCLRRTGRADAVQPRIESQLYPLANKNFPKEVSDEGSKLASLSTNATLRNPGQSNPRRVPLKTEEEVSFIAGALARVGSFERGSDVLLGKRHCDPAGHALDRNLSESGEQPASQPRLDPFAQEQSDCGFPIDDQQMEDILFNFDQNKTNSYFDQDGEMEEDY